MRRASRYSAASMTAKKYWTRLWLLIFPRRAALPERTWWSLPSTVRPIYAAACWKCFAPAGRNRPSGGEFSYRAFLNGKMDLLEAQGLCDLISAGNKAAHDLALSSLDGRLSEKLNAVKDALAEMLAELEARLDDVDEEMPPLNAAAAEQELLAQGGALARLADTFSVGRLIKEGLKAAIVARPTAANPACSMRWWGLTAPLCRSKAAPRATPWKKHWIWTGRK